jgi:hypothetical protein
MSRSGRLRFAPTGKPSRSASSKPERKPRRQRPRPHRNDADRRDGPRLVRGPGDRRPARRGRGLRPILVLADATRFRRSLAPRHRARPRHRAEIRQTSSSRWRASASPCRWRPPRNRRNDTAVVDQRPRRKAAPIPPFIDFAGWGASRGEQYFEQPEEAARPPRHRCRSFDPDGRSAALDLARFHLGHDQPHEALGVLQV